jgi:predicted ATP-grasp superfamily ATP-dependent carboligase
LVLDVAGRHSLVAVRSLGRAGLRVCGLDSVADAPAFASRFCTVAGLVPAPAAADSLVDEVIERVVQHGTHVVFTTHDGTIEALRRRRRDVEDYARLALASEEALELAVSKVRTLRLAQELGIATPKSLLVEDRRDAADAVEAIGLPLVMKPVSSWVESGMGASRLTCVLALEAADVVRALDEFRRAGGLAVAQEWLPGAREAVSLFRAEGRIWARFTQVAHRMLPPLGGASVVRESIRPRPDLDEASEQLVTACDLDGYSEIEFRRDAEGVPRLMEINPRLSASVEIAVRAGVDFPLLLYRWAAGEQLRASTGYRTGLRMRWLGGDVEWLRETLRGQGRPDIDPAAQAVARFVADTMRPMSYDYMALDDLRPALVASASWLRTARRSMLRRLRTGNLRRSRRR